VGNVGSCNEEMTTLDNINASAYSDNIKEINK
jgi:hypothetical protein